MSPPVSVKQLLESQGINYRMVNYVASEDYDQPLHAHNLRRKGAAKSTILQDEAGRMMLILSADSLLDLDLVK
ncbi:MAG: hypothetical protein AseanaTS_04260 [Candidatus Pelagadaptatus aseana]|uniref:hypothetical protein n=1 Tax=Candidatus Pelagadaptatus aseana TaxID=3120508 RepID=UPI0039B21B5D